MGEMAVLTEELRMVEACWRLMAWKGEVRLTAPWAAPVSMELSIGDSVAGRFFSIITGEATDGRHADHGAGGLDGARAEEGGHLGGHDARSSHCVERGVGGVRKDWSVEEGLLEVQVLKKEEK